MMKTFVGAIVLISSMISINSFAGETELPTVCQKEAYCHDCCIAVQTKIQQDRGAILEHPSQPATKTVEDAKQAN